jgi:hypothetical protein
LPYKEFVFDVTESGDIDFDKFYNDYTLWWLICKFNAIQDPTSFPVAGTYIKIPTTAVKDLVISQIKGS